MSFPWHHSPPLTFADHPSSPLLFITSLLLFTLLPLCGSDSLPRHGVTSHGHGVTNGVTKPSISPTLPPSHRSHMDNAERLLLNILISNDWNISPNIQWSSNLFFLSFCYERFCSIEAMFCIPANYSKFNPPLNPPGDPPSEVICHKFRQKLAFH